SAARRPRPPPGGAWQPARRRGATPARLSPATRPRETTRDAAAAPPGTPPARRRSGPGSGAADRGHSEHQGRWEPPQRRGGRSSAPHPGPKGPEAAAAPTPPAPWDHPAAAAALPLAPRAPPAYRLPPDHEPPFRPTGQLPAASARAVPPC